MTDPKFHSHLLHAKIYPMPFSPFWVTKLQIASNTSSFLSQRNTLQPIASFNKWTIQHKKFLVYVYLIPLLKLFYRSSTKSSTKSIISNNYESPITWLNFKVPRNLRLLKVTTSKRFSLKRQSNVSKINNKIPCLYLYQTYLKKCIYQLEIFLLIEIKLYILLKFL